MAADYPIFGASPDRNGGSSGQLPLSNKRWDLVTTASPRQERDVRAVNEALIGNGKLPPPSWIPIRVGDHLLMRTTERLVGVDYRTGKRVWTYPWQTASEELTEDEQSLDSMQNEKALGDLLMQRVWNDNPYGQISSDGQRVFMLDSLMEVELMPFAALNMQGTRPADGRANTLVALDLETEGKLLWRLGAGVDDGTELSNAFFLGPPLPVAGRLYVIAELAGDIILFCLDPATGKELWRQQLVAVESGGIETDAVRRVSGAVPTYFGGIMICPTGAGAIVAMDLSDRMIRWGVAYNRNVGVNNAMLQRGVALDNAQLLQRWFSGAAVVAENTVLVTPIESDRLLGLDLLTGETRFPDQNRIQFRYLAGARNGHYFVVGPDGVRAHDLSTGRTVWNSPDDLLEAGQVISGVGVFGDGEYLLPTSTNEIIRISLADGTVLGRRQTRYPLGNLVAAGGEIISQGPTKLSVAYGERSLEPLVDQMLATNPQDLDALIRKSELLIERGGRKQALELLDQANRIDPENDEIRMLNVTAMLGQLHDDPTASGELIDKLDSLIERPLQRIEYLSLLARMALEQRQHVVAVDRLIELSALLHSNPLLEPTAKEISDEAGHQSTLDQWIAARLTDVYQQTTEPERAQINQSLRKFAQAKRHGSTDYLQSIVRIFVAWNGIDAMRVELEKRLRDDSALLQLERVALGVQPPSLAGLQSLSPERLQSLAAAYADANFASDALFVLDQLQDAPETTDRPAVDQIRTAAQAQLDTSVWPEAVNLNWQSRESALRGIGFRQRTSDTKLQAGQQLRGWTLIGDQTSTMALRDRQGLMRRVLVQGVPQRDGSDKFAQISGGFMVVMTTSGLTGIDLFQLFSGNGDAVLWDRSFGGQTSPLARRRRLTTPLDDPVYRYFISTGAVQNPPELRLGPIMGDRVLLLQGGDLVAMDLMTSTTLWRNSNAPQSGDVVSDGNRVAVVSPLDQRIDFFDLQDGRKLASQPWKYGEIWESTGAHLLAYQELAGQVVIRLIDPFTEQVVLEHTTASANRKQAAAPAAYGRVVAGTYLAVYGSDGQAILWDLRQGREISNTKLTPIADLRGLHVLLLNDKLLMLPQRTLDQSQQPEAPQLQTNFGEDHHAVHAIYAISLTAGNLLWKQEFETPWGCTTTQPFDTPLVLLSRSEATDVIGSRRKTLEVLALDANHGRPLHPAKSKPVKASLNDLETRMTIQPQASRVIATIDSETLLYQFGDALPPDDAELIEYE
jgi:outer membrane protein assembly factor BamB